MKTISIYDTKKIVSDIIQPENKLLYVAGASASGKSYFAEELKKQLETEGKKVLSLSSDNYYVDNTREKHLIYGTFDHPNLIKYDELSEAVATYLETKKIDIPQYSFVESKRTGYDTFEGDVDHIIIEGLYTLSLMPRGEKSLSFFVDSESEELIMRRLIRDQKRTEQAPNLIINDISKVFPMRNIYGKPQRELTDYMINNDYEILELQGEESHFDRYTGEELSQPVSELFFIDYEYNDESNGNGTLIVSEVYKEQGGDLDHVILSKRKDSHTKNTESFKTLSVKLDQQGVITTIHALAQLAGLHIIHTVRKTISTYTQGDTIITLKKRGDDVFQLISSL